MDKKLINIMENLCCAREHSVQFFFCGVFYTVILYSLAKNMCGLLDLMAPKDIQ